MVNSTVDKTAKKTKPGELDDPISQLPRVGPSIVTRFKRLGIERIAGLLERLPFRTEDYRLQKKICELKFGEEVTVSGVIGKVSSRRSKRGILLIEATISDDTGKLKVVWFNQRYLLWQLKEGQEILLFGTRKLAPPMGNPFFVKKIITAVEVIPIYPTTAGLSQATWRRLLLAARPSLKKMSDVLPRVLLDQLPSRRGVLEKAHFEPSRENIEQARWLLGLEELTALRLAIDDAKSSRRMLNAPKIELDQNHLKQLVGSLPYRLSDNQRRSAWEIVQAFSSSSPMNRLLCGEVGSGKTTVALIVASLAAKSGLSVAWLNPTTALAAQQFAVIGKLLKPIGQTVSLWTGESRDNEPADLIIGTHALLSRQAHLPPVGLVIVDEQQRFGVNQRQGLLAQFPNAHLLLMTATPIPRSLAQTVFGHLDLTYLSGRLAHQKRVATRVFTEDDRSEIESEIALRLLRGEPGFVVCPFIDPGELDRSALFTQERKAVLSEGRRLKKVFPHARLAVLHGRLKEEEKVRLLDGFRKGEVDILLSTSVVETGIDNPLASWILVESAERFGLSQLHQLRGRVGRGGVESICYLANSSLEPSVATRLAVLTKLDDGLMIAEQDLALRGPGELTGLQQSGLPPLHYGSLTDTVSVQLAGQIAQALAKDDLRQYPALKMMTEKWQQNGSTIS